MDRVFFEQLELPPAEYNLDAGSGTHADQTGRIMTGIEKVLMEIEPDVVLVQGDTNTVLAGALTAAKLHIKVGHVESGLRSYDRSMPEEINRVVADHISDHLFAPTENSRANLIKEGISSEKISVTGNTIVDSVYQNREIADRKVNVLKDLGLKPKEYFLATAHRAENVDNRSRLKEIFKGLKLIMSEFGLPVIFPMHPRTPWLSGLPLRFDHIHEIIYNDRFPLGTIHRIRQMSAGRLQPPGPAIRKALIADSLNVCSLSRRNGGFVTVPGNIS